MTSQNVNVSLPQIVTKKKNLSTLDLCRPYLMSHNNTGEQFIVIVSNSECVCIEKNGDILWNEKKFFEANCIIVKALDKCDFTMVVT